MRYYNNSVNTDDVIKYLFEAKKDEHAQRVMRMAEQLKLMEGQMDVLWFDRNSTAPPNEPFNN